MSNIRDNTILVTGANGFIGSRLTAFLSARNFHVLAAARSPERICKSGNVTPVVMPDLGDQNANWSSLVSRAAVVIHTAGLAHVSLDDERHDLINHRAVATLANAAWAHRVAQFIFLSSVAVNTGAFCRAVINEDSAVAPVNAYGRAKRDAETAIRLTGVPFSILRPCMVYGEEASGTYRTLAKIAALPLPLPFASLRSKRSVLAVENLLEAILAVIDNEQARDGLFLVADTPPGSVATILENIRRSRGQRPGLWPCPPALIKVALKLAGLSGIWERIGEPLEVDSSRLRSIGWNPASD